VAVEWPESTTRDACRAPSGRFRTCRVRSCSPPGNERTDVSKTRVVPATVALERRSLLDDLVGLFIGDCDSCGYAHPMLVAAICDELESPTIEALRRVLSPESGDHPDPEVDEIIRKGFDRWRYGRAGRSPVTVSH
jgi:hypothetical protein